MNNSRASLAVTPPIAAVASASMPAFYWPAACLLLLASAGIPLSLLWDFSWESTVGVDLVWSPPHTANYLAVALAGLTALVLVLTTTRGSAARAGAVRLGQFHAPLGVWLAAWGTLAFLAAVLFDRWWQSAYGLAAGIWHPPQILKAVAFFAVIVGAWLYCLNWQNQQAGEKTPGGAATFACGGGLVLALITVVTLTLIYPNRQHSASFYKVACCTYPIVLVALATAGKLQWPATVAALVYTAVICSMVWLLPLFPARPQVPPIYNQLDHLMAPPFPLLLVAPAIALDALLRFVPSATRRGETWFRALAAGLVFFSIFVGAQWLFAEFLLDDLADNWFFAGGGREWPFFLKIDAPSRVAFWKMRQDEFNLTSALVAVGLAVLAARIGLWLGAWMTRVRR